MSHDSNNRLGTALDLIEKGEPRQAMSLLRPLISEFPENHQVHCLLARAAFLAGDFVKAAKTAKRAALLKPKYRRYNSIVARSLYRLGDTIGSEDAWRLALAADKSPPSWYADFAAVCHANGRTSEALLAYDKAIAHAEFPRPSWWRGKGACALWLGDNAQALNAFRKAAEGGLTELKSLVEELELQLHDEGCITVSARRKGPGSALATWFAQSLARAARCLARNGWTKHRVGRELIDVLLLPSDVARIRRSYMGVFGSPPRLFSPRSFNENIQHTKIFRRKQRYVRFCDKLAVRDFVAERIGPEVLTQLHWVGSDLQDARRQTLPQKFVLKANHSCNANLIVRDASALDWDAAQTLTRRWLSEDFSARHTEWQYRWVPRKLLIEEYLDDPSRSVPLDYKFLCFNGRVEMIQVDVDRFSQHRTQVLLDRDFRPLPVKFNCPQYNGELSRPPFYERMLDIAERLAAGEKFLRVDLYDLGRPVFGELTLTPGAGYGRIEPSECDQKLGALWT
jgi:Tfp pilus assembly protein PilF